ncbi:MAG TPA: hypothetical protein VEK84_08680 [Terriglobales bacterium]|nr:hypothetical protein [Terriglobales bacterium]
MRTPTLKLSARAKKILLKILVGLVMVYGAFGSYIWWAMHQTPETFGKVMSRMPGPVPFLLFPFETFWLRARAGYLNAGDRAPMSLVTPPSRLTPDGQTVST